MFPLLQSVHVQALLSPNAHVSYAAINGDQQMTAVRTKVGGHIVVYLSILRTRLHMQVGCLRLLIILRLKPSTRFLDESYAQPASHNLLC